MIMEDLFLDVRTDRFCFVCLFHPPPLLSLSLCPLATEGLIPCHRTVCVFIPWQLVTIQGQDMFINQRVRKQIDTAALAVDPGICGGRVNQAKTAAG